MLRIKDDENSSSEEGEIKMSNDRTIGRIVLVDSYKAIVEIDKDLKSLTKTAFTGTYDFARINSYVIIPVESSK